MLGVWAGRKYCLDKMSLGDLVRAYFTYYAILVYLGLMAASAARSASVTGFDIVPSGITRPDASSVVFVMIPSRRLVGSRKPRSPASANRASRLALTNGDRMKPSDS